MQFQIYLFVFYFLDKSLCLIYKLVNCLFEGKYICFFKNNIIIVKNGIIFVEVKGEVIGIKIKFVR